jgi:hypothetical protein
MASPPGACPPVTRESSGPAVRSFRLRPKAGSFEPFDEVRDLLASDWTTFETGRLDDLVAWLQTLK